MNIKPGFKSVGFTAIELVVVITIILLLLSMMLPAMNRAKAKAPRIACVNNLKSIGTAYRVWAGDHDDMFPFSVSRTNDGWRELLADSNQGINCWTNYALMSKELGMTPRTLICPTDERRPATNFAAMVDNTSVSYFVGVSANDTQPQSVLGGDRNLGPGLTPQNDYGFSPADNRGNDVILRSNTPVCWSLKMHSGGSSIGAANLLLGDGSVQQVTSSRFRTDLQAVAAGTNNSFRLIFP